MKRRDFLHSFFTTMLAAGGTLAWAGEEIGSDAVSGTLSKNLLGEPALQTKQGAVVTLVGDKSTTEVLNDERLAGAFFEVAGKHRSGGKFAVNPIHEKAMHVVKDGKRLLISYWCDICSIRTYAPGPCMCCQAETELQLRESLD
jgi:hypothetical protein